MDRTPKTHQKHQKPTKKDTQLIQDILKDKGAEQFFRLRKGLCVEGEGLAPGERRWECGVSTHAQESV